MINLKKRPPREAIRFKRALRVRRHLRGSAQKPRLCVVKTNAHIQAQIIDDEAQVTLVGVGTNSKGTPFGKKSKSAAEKMGAVLAEQAKAKGIEQVVFDRGPSKYHGILAALADSARSNGLKF